MHLEPSTDVVYSTTVRPHAVSVSGGGRRVTGRRLVVTLCDKVRQLEALVLRLPPLSRSQHDHRSWSVRCSSGRPTRASCSRSGPPIPDHGGPVSRLLLSRRLKAAVVRRAICSNKLSGGSPCDPTCVSTRGVWGWDGTHGGWHD